MDQAKCGADALSAGKYADALTFYTSAIAAVPTSPDYFIKRSTAFQRSSPPDFASAFSDAEMAVVLAQGRARRELIVQAQLRRGIALFGLERYADAEFVLDVVKRMDPKEKTLAIWQNKIKSKLAGLEEGDSRKKVTVKETPDVDPAKAASPASAPPKVTTLASNGPSAAAKTEPTTPVQTPANKVRHDWYQNSDKVYITLLAKGVPKDKAIIDVQERSVSISFPIVSSADFEFTLDPLFAAVDASASTYSVLSTKVEVVLKKSQPGQKWSALESSEPVSTTSTDAKTTIPQHILETSAQPAGPSYPTSSRSGPKNWDKLVEDLTAKKPKADKNAEGTAGKDDDDYDYDAEGGDEVNAFFKKLYKGADPDVQRAMMKSFTESNGTALSTNWGEVSKGPVETSPPDGMVARTWDK